MNHKIKLAKRIVSFGPVKSVVVGSMAGAAIGYFASPKTMKKLVSSIDRKALKDKGIGFGKATKEKLAGYQGWGLAKSKLTANHIKSAATRLLNKEEKMLLKQDSKSNIEDDAEKRDRIIAEENEKLSKRIDLLEEKLKDLDQADDEKNQNQKKTTNKKKSSDSNSSKKTKKSDSDTAVSSDDDTVSAKQ